MSGLDGKKPPTPTKRVIIKDSTTQTAGENSH